MFARSGESGPHYGSGNKPRHHHSHHHSRGAPTFVVENIPQNKSYHFANIPDDDRGWTGLYPVDPRPFNQNVQEQPGHRENFPHGGTFDIRDISTGLITDRQTRANTFVDGVPKSVSQFEREKMAEEQTKKLNQGLIEADKELNFIRNLLEEDDEAKTPILSPEERERLIDVGNKINERKENIMKSLNPNFALEQSLNQLNVNIANMIAERKMRTAPLTAESKRLRDLRDEFKEKGDILATLKLSAKSTEAEIKELEAQRRNALSIAAREASDRAIAKKRTELAEIQSEVKRVDESFRELVALFSGTGSFGAGRGREEEKKVEEVDEEEEEEVEVEVRRAGEEPEEVEEEPEEVEEEPEEVEEEPTVSSPVSISPEVMKLVSSRPVKPRATEEKALTAETGVSSASVTTQELVKIYTNYGEKRSSTGRAGRRLNDILVFMSNNDNIETMVNDKDVENQIASFNTSFGGLRNSLKDTGKLAYDKIDSILNIVKISQQAGDEIPNLQAVLDAENPTELKKVREIETRKYVGDVARKQAREGKLPRV